MKIQRNSRAISKKVGSQWIILEPNKKYIRTLNTNAGIIWALTEKPISTETVIRKLTDRHKETPEQQIRKDVTGFVQQYIREGLLTVA